MNQTCFVCNTPLEISSRNAVNIFNETVFRDTTLAGFLSSLFEQNIPKGNVHSQVICKKCHGLCIEYQSMQLKLQETKTELLNLFKSTHSNLQLSHNQYDMSQTVNEKEKPMVRLVLPASRLQPLPPNYVINLEKNNLSSKKPQIMAISSSQIVTRTANMPRFYNPLQLMTTLSLHGNNKIATDIHPNSLLATGTKNQIKNKCDEGTLVTNIDTECYNKEGIQTTIASSMTKLPIQKSSMIAFDVNTLPKDFLDDGSNSKQDGESSEDLDDDQELPMEIDEDWTYVRIPAADGTDPLLNEHDERNSETSSNYVTIKSLTNDGKSILGTVKLERPQPNDTEDTDEDQQTIVMEDENGSLLQMMSGQKLVYSAGNFTLLMPSDQDDDGDGNDSTEESQIELQVSDDDETAKAIIAAAKEEGGAFIKVESGEFFRVTSVKSQSIEEAEDNAKTQLSLDMVKECNGKFTCLLCSKSAKGQEAEILLSGEDMMQHLKAKHNARLYICWVCNHMLRRRTDLASHLETHKVSKVDLKTKQYVCNLCDKKYNSKTLLQEHMNLHSGKRPYICLVCEKTFASKYTLQAHHKTHSERPRPYKCEKCPKAFLNLQNLTQHEKTHLGIKDFVCNSCGKAFATQHNLEVHQVIHLGMKPFACDTCGKAFARRNELKDHMRIHTGERPFACDICGAAFAQRSNLATHKRDTHLNESRYHCSQCPKKFKRRRLLDYHVKASHTGERPLICKVCNATFVYPEHYRKHQRIHSGEKPYDCEVCGKTFNSRDNRNTHRFVHSDKKPYECLVCGTGYMRKQLLYAHMNTSGHLAESIVVNQPRVQKIATRDKLNVASFGSSGGLEIVPTNEDNTEGDEETKIYLTDPSGDRNYVLLDVGDDC